MGDDPHSTTASDEPSADAKENSAPSAPADLAEWERSLPACESAYVSDERHPMLAFPVMVAGVVASAAAGAALAFLMLGLFALLLGCYQAMSAVIEAVVDLLGKVGDVIIIIVLALFSFGGIAVGAGATVPRFARLARNRNTLATFAYGTAAGLLAAVVVKTSAILIAAVQGFEPVPPSLRADGVWAVVRFSVGVNTLDRVLTVVWAAASALMAGVVAFGDAAGDRYCDRCSRFMKCVVGRRVGYGCLRRIVQAVTTRDFATVRRALKDDRRQGPGGSVDVHRCDRCGGGYVEATAAYRTDDQSRLWTVASARLDAADVDAVWTEGDQAPDRGRKRRRPRRG